MYMCEGIYIHTIYIYTHLTMHKNWDIAYEHRKKNTNLERSYKRGEKIENKIIEGMYRKGRGPEKRWEGTFCYSRTGSWPSAFPPLPSTFFYSTCGGYLARFYYQMHLGKCGDCALKYLWEFTTTPSCSL